MNTDAPVHDEAAAWPVVASATPFTGSKTSMRVDDVRMPDGSVHSREYLAHPGSVGILALGEDDRVTVIQQYRHPVRSRLWELPAGMLDVHGENPLHAAQRELYEEAHLRADEWHVLADIYATPGGCDEAVRIFLARGLSAAEGERYAVAEEEADLRHARVPVAELSEGVLGGRLQNSLLAVGVLALQAARAAGALSSLRPADSPWPARPFS